MVEVQIIKKPYNASQFIWTSLCPDQVFILCGAAGGMGNYPLSFREDENISSPIIPP